MQFGNACQLDKFHPLNGVYVWFGNSLRGDLLGELASHVPSDRALPFEELAKIT
jgi:hypothetical protein